MINFKNMVKMKLLESDLTSPNVHRLLTEGFAIDDETRNNLRELYAAISSAADINDKMINSCQNGDMFTVTAAYKAFEDKFNDIAFILISKVLDERGTDDLHDIIFHNIRSLVANNPGVVSELEHIKSKATADEINNEKGLSEPSKQLMRLETALRYIRYIGSVRSYLGFGYKNEISKVSVVGRYRLALKKAFEKDEADVIAKTIQSQGNTVTESLGFALSTLENLGKNMFPKDKKAPVV